MVRARYLPWFRLPLYRRKWHEATRASAGNMNGQVKDGEIDLLISEVGLRDGLQNCRGVMATESKIAWITAEADAGCREIEVCSFVPPALVKGMTDAVDVVHHARSIVGLRVAALAPNLRGAIDAMNAGVDKITMPVSVSESHSQANVRKSRRAMIDEVRAACGHRDHLPETQRPVIEAGMTTAFGCTLEGVVSEREVLATAVACREAGVDEIGLADTAGMANPDQVKRLFKSLKSEVGDALQGVHLHNTYGLGLANACAAIEAGATALDSSLGGLGGCPFAPGASGNIVTEDLVFMLESMGLRTGINLEKLLTCRHIVEVALPEDLLYGHVAAAGLPITMR